MLDRIKSKVATSRKELTSYYFSLVDGKSPTLKLYAGN